MSRAGPRTKRRPAKRSSAAMIALAVAGIVGIALMFGACQMVRTDAGGAGAIVVLFLLWLLGMPFLASVLAGLKNRSP